MSVSETLDAGIRNYQLLGRTFLRVSALPSLFCLGAVIFLSEFIGPNLFTTSNPNQLAAQVGEVAAQLALALFVGGPLFLIGASMNTASVCSLTADAFIGEVPDLEAALKASRRVLPTLVKVHLRELLLSLSGFITAVLLLFLSAWLSSVTSQDALWTGVVAFLGVVGIMAGAVVFLAVISVHALSSPVAVIEGASPKVAGRRSRDLLRARYPTPSGTNAVWNLYAMLFLVWLVLGSADALVFQAFDVGARVRDLMSALPFAGLLERMVAYIGTYVTIWLAVPLWASVITVIYFERRIRLEGFDVATLAEDAGRDKTSRFQL
jgi:hypothetical protein